MVYVFTDRYAEETIQFQREIPEINVKMTETGIVRYLCHYEERT